jgi:polysaccharide export outer membrane protein
MRQVLFSTVACAALAACGGGGPSARTIAAGSELTVGPSSSASPYVVVDVNDQVAPAVSRALEQTPKFFGSAKSGPVVIGAGDAVQISIVSSSEAGFVDFASASLSPISTTTLPPQTISETGTINMPPIGRLKASGLTVQQLETELEERLGEVLVDPSVIVELVDRESARVKVVGEVGAPGAVPLTEVNTRLLDVILSSGGPSGRSEDILVSVSRAGHTRTVELRQLYEEPRLNITVQADDVVALELADQKITILGATGNQTLRFNEQDVTLAEALAESGGFQSPRSKRTGVFLYRPVPREALAGIGADIDAIPGERINAVFRFDFTDPSIMFTANAFEIADGDVLYVADSVNAEISNVLSVFTSFIPAPSEFTSDAVFD